MCTGIDTDDIIIDVNYEYFRYNSPSKFLSNFRNSNLNSRVILNTKNDDSISNNVLFHLTYLFKNIPSMKVEVFLFNKYYSYA